MRIQDKSNNFVFLDKDMDSRKVREQMERGSFKMLEQDISVETCSEILKWAKKRESRGLSSLLLILIGHTQVLIIPLLKLIKLITPHVSSRLVVHGTFTENLSLFVEKYCQGLFNIYTGGAKAPPAPMLPPPPPLKGFGPPSNVPFCLKMSENHAEIAGNQV